MATTSRRAATRPPDIYVSMSDHQRLSALVGFAADPRSGAALLREELDRAVIVGPAERAPSFVRVDSTVTYEDCANGKTRTVQLVLPDAADIDEGRVSVLTPVGAALLGLKVGQVFTWATADGRLRTVRVVGMEDGHEAA